MVFILLLSTVLLLPSVLDASQVGFPKCPLSCPKGSFATEVFNLKDKLVCICKDPCEGVECPAGTECVPDQDHYCIRFPCPPSPKCIKMSICKHGPPQRTKEGLIVICRRGQYRQPCARRYKCKSSPSVNYGLCCPRRHRCPKGLVWNECGSACPPRCKKYGSLICITVCVPRCECPRKRPILHKGKCITRAKCPKRHCRKH